MGPGSLIAIPLAIVAGALILGVAIFLFIKVFDVLWRLIVHVVRTVGAIIADIFRFLGAVIVALVFIPLTLLNIVIGRWSASAHYGRAFTAECRTAAGCFYRVLIGHPLRLFGLGGLTEGLEKRLPQAMAEAPGPDKPSKRQGMFEGYRIVGSLPGGGSGGKLYIAEPDEMKRAGFARRGHADIDRVVIKTFSLGDGSSLPQIVRESRALDAAKKMGLVLEHDLGDERFFYVMRYVPGESLTAATQRLHAAAGSAGLDPRGLRLAMGYAADLLESLDTYHRGGLWHKDVKPDNVIIDHEADPALGRGRAHLVDFGLVTPLRSAMTLTTHGTEYFRDPELVRQALRGVKVHQIDGARFDLYAAGAVLYAIIENSFPAHGGLSQITRKCPEALRWIVRRAMADYDKRYASAIAMLEDLRVVAAAADPYEVKPIDLPSMKGGAPAPMPEPEPVAFEAAASPVPPRGEPQRPASPAPRTPPKLRVADWWTGRYEVADRGAQAPGNAPGFVAQADIGVGPRRQKPAPFVAPRETRASAADQLENARRRVAERRARAARGPRGGFNPAHGPTRLAGRRTRRHEPAGLNAGVVFAALLGIAIGFGAIMMFVLPGGQPLPLPGPGGNIGVVEAPAPPAISDAASDLVPAPTRDLAGLGLAVLCDFRPPYDEALLKEIELAGLALDTAGVRIVSNIRLGERPESDAQDAVLLARLLAARGQATLDEALAPVLAAIIAEDPALDAVWWIGPGDEPGERRYLLLDEHCSTALTTSEIGLDNIATAFVSREPAVTEPAVTPPPTAPEPPQPPDDAG
jgi:serine/threonine protein kinase